MKFSLTHLIICMILASSFQMMKSSKIRNRILEDEEAAEEENDAPDLDMLEELEDEIDGDGGNIFDELVNEKQEMMDRLKMLQCMVEAQLATRDHLDEENDTKKGKFLNNFLIIRRGK